MHPESDTRKQVVEMLLNAQADVNIKDRWGGTPLQVFDTRDFKPETRSPRLETRDLKPETRNSKPATRNPEPETLTRIHGG